MALNKFYGVRVTEADSANSSATNGSGIPFVVGTAPVHQVGGTANQIVVAYTFDEAVSALGWSEDWEKYTLCEAMYCQLKLYGYGPMLLVNVLNPSDYASDSTTSGTYTISSGKVTLNADVLPDTVSVTDSDNNAYTEGTDYDVFYEDGVCYIEVLEDGGIDEAGLTELVVEFSTVDFEASDLKEAVIGGEDADTGVKTGLELIESAYYKDRVLPDIIIAPGFSQYPEVAAVMAAKAQGFSTVFRAIAYCDIDTSENTTYTAAVTYKENNSEYTMLNQAVCWPMVKDDTYTYHLSTQMAAMSSKIDSQNDAVPSGAISNVVLEATTACLADGTELLLDITQANYLRSNGIVTAYNFVEGFTIWGVYASCWPENDDPKDCMIHAKRMMIYICNQLILRNWSKIDQKLTARTGESIADETTIWLGELSGDGHILGGRAEFNTDENSYEDFAAGILYIHVYVGVPGVLQELDFTVEYDASYLEEAYEQAFEA